MKPSLSLSTPLKQLISCLVSAPALHGKWLNTLSFLENCGARKIAACEHPTLVKEEMLKHAAEEFRHAHYLKRQITKVTTPLLSYNCTEILGGMSTLHYLCALDLQASHYLKSQGILGSLLKEASYLLVTYAIELRAAELYPLYDEILRQTKSKVAVKSILLEEKEHLNEMIEGLSQFPHGFIHAEKICEMESVLCKNWLQTLFKELARQTSTPCPKRIYF